MPFPAAHPAAVLPLRRYCPRYLSFPALLIGSVTPDLGYCFRRMHVAEFSHRFFAGSFLFCLPVGGLIFLLFQLSRPWLMRVAANPHLRALLTSCQCLPCSKAGIVLSILVGSWTHLILDSLTHEDGWLVEHIPSLHSSFGMLGQRGIRTYDFLYAFCTFLGVLWLSLSYLRWLDTSAVPRSRKSSFLNWVYSFLLAGSMLFVAMASRGEHPSMRMRSMAATTILAVTAYLVMTGISTTVQKSGRE